MKTNTTASAYILIDMENGFVSPESAHCIKNARATVPACERTIAMAREKGIPIFFVKRIYRADGSDVEITRYHQWVEGGRSMSPASQGENSAEGFSGLKPQPGDYSIIKPRWSAFFHTELDLILRRLGVRNVILAGTTTPNCVRTTCYDANSLEYNVVVLEDCCSSQTEEIQRVNIEDMKRMGAVIMSSHEFINYDENTIADMSKIIRNQMEEENYIPEPFEEKGVNRTWTDIW